MIYEIEHTDTFGGEANYSWVKRTEIEHDGSDLALVRKAKAFCGLSGVRGRMKTFGDHWRFYPYRQCTVMFITAQY